MRLFLLFLFLGIQNVFSQIVKISPVDANLDQEVEIIYDAAQGTGSLKGASAVYMHSGVIIDGPDGAAWTSVVGNWGKDDGIGKMTKMPGQNELWTIKLKSIRSYYGLSVDAIVFRLSMVFRNADGTKEGKGNPGNFIGGFVASNQDIYINLKVGNFILFSQPTETDVLVKDSEKFNIAVKSSSKADSISIKTFLEGKLLSSKLVLNADIAELASAIPPSSSALTVEIYARWKQETQKIIKTINVVVLKNKEPQPLPSGATRGITYLSNTKVRFVLEAPGKQLAYVVGDHSDWKTAEQYRMNQTPDSKFFWLEIEGLEKAKPYVYQYWVDAGIKISDPYSDQVADPWNDIFIPRSTFPNPPPYIRNSFGIASVFQTAQQPYVWSTADQNFKPVAKDKMIIYELLIRDFISDRSYTKLIDSLDYLKKLGVNTIELMPIMEFEGNESWGYNPSHFFAPDKAYGTKNDLKRFIDKAHQKGFTVLLDMVLNHAFGQSPMVKLYWDAQKNKPATNNPWFNPDATHPFNVGFDFNHESAATQQFVDDVNAYWLNEYHFDGYRFDLSKGFTQKQNTDVGLWSVKDDSRIRILKRMNEQIKKVKPNAIVILEHFADAAEETELHADGMLTWSNTTYGFTNLLNAAEDDVFNQSINLNKVSYMESHDEERLMVKGKKTNAKNATQSFSDSLFVLNKIKQMSAFFFPLPGPKMLWQFQELAYNKSIDFNGRVGNKPLPWGSGGLGLYEDKERKKLLAFYQALLKVVYDNPKTFDLKNLKANLNTSLKTYSFSGPDFDWVAVGNFGTQKQTASFTLTNAGTWYEFFGRESPVAGSNTQSIELFPGAFRIFTSKKFDTSPGLVSDVLPILEIDKLEPKDTDELTLTFHADRAVDTQSEAIAKQTALYLVMAPVTDGSNSTKVGASIGTSNQYALVKQANSNMWQLKIKPKELLGFAPTDKLNRLALYVKNSQGTAEGKAYDKSWLFINFKSSATIVSINPPEFDENTPISITLDAAAADPGSSAGLVGASKVYLHAGIISDSPTSTSWKYVVGNWGKDDGLGLMTKIPGTEKWEIKLKPKEYFKEVPAASAWYRIGMVFRNESGNKEGKDIGGKDFFFNFSPGVTKVTGIHSSPQKTWIYPNPSMGTVFIPQDSEILGLYNEKGSSIDYIKVSTNQLSLEAGTYWLALKTGGKVEFQKLIVQK
jgi:1,4-alpha-glucan branching enzyme